jgi:hypothetical protein
MDLPTGTVTFLFTDIEGSTRLLRELGAGYWAVQRNHMRPIREAIASGEDRETWIWRSPSRYWSGQELPAQGCD